MIIERVMNFLKLVFLQNGNFAKAWFLCEKNLDLSSKIGYIIYGILPR